MVSSFLACHVDPTKFHVCDVIVTVITPYLLTFLTGLGWLKKRPFFETKVELSERKGPGSPNITFRQPSSCLTSANTSRIVNNGRRLRIRPLTSLRFFVHAYQEDIDSFILHLS